MKKILFVEDNPRLLEELIEIIQEEEPNWIIDISSDIPSAWQKLSREEYDLIVIDIMLPTWNDIPSRSEGIYLAAFILDIDRDSKLKPPSNSILARNRKINIIFLTARNKIGVKEEILQTLNEEFLIISRLEFDAYEQYLKIKTII